MLSVNFSVISEVYPGFEVQGVAEFYTPKDRWTSLVDDAPINQQDRSPVAQVLLACMQGATKVSMALKEAATGRVIEECFQTRELIS